MQAAALDVEDYTAHLKEVIQRTVHFYRLSPAADRAVIL
jgi:hypothetical protein